MELLLKFELKDFENFKSFEKAVKKQLGNNVFVGTDSMAVYFDYSPQLKAMLRPYPETKQLEFVLTASHP